MWKGKIVVFENGGKLFLNQLLYFEVSAAATVGQIEAFIFSICHFVLVFCVAVNGQSSIGPTMVN